MFALEARESGTHNSDVSADRAIGIEAVLAVSAKSHDAGGGVTLDVKFQLQDPASKNFIDIPGAAYTQMTDVGAQRLVIHPLAVAVGNQAVGKAITKHLRCVAVIVTVDEQQVVTITDGAGVDTFNLTFAGQTTAEIAWDAAAATIKTAMALLSNLDAADLTVARTGTGPITVTFGGAYAGTDVSEMTGVGTGCDVAIATTVVGGGSVTFGLHLRLLEA